MIDPKVIAELRDLLARATHGDWHAGHFSDETHSCQCRYVFSEGHMGGIAEVYVDNGIKSIADGANDCPVAEEAKANLLLIPAMKNALPALLEAVSPEDGSTFHFRLNDGEEQTITVKTGVYTSAVAAIPALLGIEQDQYPLTVEIWVPSLLPQYGPYRYYIGAAGAEVRSLMMVGGVLTAVGSGE